MKKAERGINRRSVVRGIRPPLVALPMLLSLAAVGGCAGPGKPLMGIPGSVEVADLVPQALDIVSQGLSDPEPVMKVNSIEVVATTGQIRMMPQVQRLATDQVPRVRFATALAIGDLEYGLGRSTAEQMLSDQDENVRLAALYATVRLGSRENLEMLRGALNSENQTVRADAAILLGKTADKSAETRRVLWWTLGREGAPDKVIFQAAEAIAMLGDERVYPKLWTMLISRFADVRVMGVRAMGALGTSEARNALITMLDDDLPEVRLAAADELGALGETTGERVVLDILRKRPASAADPRARERMDVFSAVAIGGIGTPRLIKFLPGMLRHESKAVRLAAARAVLGLAARTGQAGKLDS